MTPEGRARKPGPLAIRRASSSTVRDTDGVPGAPRGLLDPYRRAVRRQPKDATAWYELGLMMLFMYLLEAYEEMHGPSRPSGRRAGRRGAP